MKMKTILPLVLFAVLVGFLAFGLTRNPATIDSVLIDTPFPEFELTDLYDPDQVVTKADLTGEIVLVNVFGSWCVACVQEHPKLVELSNTANIKIVGVDWRDTRENGMAWLKKYGDPYHRVVFDADSLLAIDLGITGAPESYLVDKQGDIRYKHVGIITDQVWDDILAPIVVQLRTE
ncbi:MAG: DsbE family thiol:disulfide interchange protein [Acidimicrobiales bacterium]|nr:DsbE family thiol:disulfide interchange protein [Hyphomonadaceae bacterium]RZV42556.1 MAG: DsbE family thiol:disulfide interchange protein [Acidimicrobiales bacterium]